MAYDAKLANVRQPSAYNLTIEAAGFDADGENMVVDLLRYNIDRYPTDWSFIITRTVGSTNTISVALQGSINNSVFEDILTETDVTGGTSAHVHTVNDYSGSASPRKQYRYIKLLVSTIGAGNTLTIEAVGG